MAVRRMIHRDIVCSDEFISMSYAAQALFLQFTIEADEFGFVAGAKRIMRAINVDDSILSELITADFVYRFNSGVVLMRDWDRANTRKNDRQHKVAFPHEYAMLEKDENGRYIIMDSAGIQWNPMESENSPAQQSIAQQKYISPVATASHPGLDTLEAYKHPRFIPPSLKQVQDYIAEHNLNVNGQRFISYYKARGWKMGNNPMQDWEAALDYWNTQKQGNGGIGLGRDGVAGSDSATDDWSNIDPERKQLFEQAFAEGT